MAVADPTCQACYTPITEGQSRTVVPKRGAILYCHAHWQHCSAGLRRDRQLVARKKLLPEDVDA